MKRPWYLPLGCTTGLFAPRRCCTESSLSPVFKVNMCIMSIWRTIIVRKHKYVFFVCPTISNSLTTGLSKSPSKVTFCTDFYLRSGAGTERHRGVLKMAVNNMIGGAFCLTEISHGTNTKVQPT